MYTTKNTLPKEARPAMVTSLNTSLVSAVDLQAHTKQAHWSAKEANFIALHKLLDQINGAVALYADTIEVTRHSHLPKYSIPIEKGADHAEAVATSLATLDELVRETSYVGCGQGGRQLYQARQSA